MQKTHQPASLSRYWLLLGVMALGIAGMFALVLVLARTPSLASVPLFARLFHQSLVVHVDLSVLVWFLSIACLMWSLMTSLSRSIIPYIEEGALICFAVGMLVIACSPFDPKAVALMSNYIPVLMSPLFFLGLALIMCGVLLMLLRVFTALTLGVFARPLRFGLYTAAIITLIAMVAFFWSYRQMPHVIDGEQYYELVFWGGGHILQFTHTQILLVCWLLLAQAINPAFLLRNVLVYMLFSVGLIVSMATPLAYMGHDITSPEYREFFTRAMIAGGGSAPALLALLVLPCIWQHRKQRKGKKRALWMAFTMSIILFLYGGILGEMIQGQNVVIPAHYHGSIVGITLAFMGVAYLLLPKFGYRDVAAWRTAYWQPIVYGFGQLLHISGLAWSGGYGVLRKTTGTLEGSFSGAKAAMGLMGAGGLLAVIGGLMFVVVVIRSVRGRGIY